MSRFNISGLGSGLDTQSIIAGLLEIERQPIVRLQGQKANLTAKSAAFGLLNSRLLGLQSSLSALTKKAAFNPLSTTSTDSEKVTASATSDAIAGQYTVGVTKLAQSHKLSSSSFSSRDQGLSISGQFIINGKAIEVTATDSLNAIATKINAANAGVQATILSAGSDQYYLNLTSKQSGAEGEISISDADSGLALQNLGILNTAQSLRHSITGGGASDSFANSTGVVGTLLGMPQPTSGNVTIKGSDVAIDLGTMSLQDIATAINNAGITGVSAIVAPVVEDGETRSRLEITGITSGDIVDSSRIFSAIGVTKFGYAAERTAAQDAEFTIDGVVMTRSSNIISDAVTGVTFTLINTTDSDVTIAVNKDLATIKQSINDFVKSYNDVVTYMNDSSTYNTELNSAPALFGEAALQTVETGISSLAGTFVKGLYNSSSDIGVIPNALSLVGISVAQNGQLTVDDGKLTAALENNSDYVMQVFQAVGTTTDPSIQYLGKTDETQGTFAPDDPRFALPLDVNITRVAEKASVTAGMAQTGANATSEKLTFSGALFGGTPLDLYLGPNNTLADTVAQINNDPRLKDKVYASIENNKLKLVSVSYGSAASFSVVSDQAANGNNSGIGTSVLSGDGVDVEGTIGGRAAVGKGQVLTGIASAQVTAQTAQTQNLAADETLTFSGKLFDNTPYTLNLTAGMSIDDVISAINADATLNQKVTASKQNGRIVITSNQSGESVSFTVVSDRAAASDSTGIGTTTLTGSGGGGTEGMALLVTATTTGVKGSVRLSMGIADQMERYLKSVTDSVDGLLTQETKAISDKITSLDESIARHEQIVQERQRRLEMQFAALEGLLGKLQAQSRQLASQLGALPGFGSGSNINGGGFSGGT